MSTVNSARRSSSTPSSSNGKQRLAISAKTRTLEFRYGISFISVEQAKKNLQHEIPAPGFDAIKAAAKARWNETLGRITVEGGTPDAKARLLYRALPQL